VPIDTLFPSRAFETLRAEESHGYCAINDTRFLNRSQTYCVFPNYYPLLFLIFRYLHI